ncbi:MlaD family protein [Paraconexibacter sp.]|uniref:MlaD family protein n=1 Tax=Paraconexibacter sp. TaxID=2949640 RepID=UPI0035650F25
METRSPSLRLVVLPVLFTLACVVLTLLTYWTFGGHLPLEPKGYRVSIPFSASSNLVAGSQVQIAGVPIGEVTEVRRVGNRAEAEVEIDRRFAPLGTQAKAVARTKTLLGEGYVEIAPGPREAPRIPDGGRLAAHRVVRNVQLDEFFATFDPRTRDRIHELFGGLAEAVDGRAPEISGSLGSAAGLSAGLDQVLSVLDTQRTDLQGLVSSSADVLGAVGDQAGLVQAAVRAGNDVLATTADRERQVRATVRALPPFLAQLRTTSRTVTAAAPDLNRAVKALEPPAAKAVPALREIRQAAPEFRSVFRELTDVVGEGRRSLPALTAMVEPARTALEAFYPTARELIPIMELIAANPEGPVAAFANVANITNGVFVGPGGLVQHYATGLPTVWNETIGGWKKRLPTNILNPYVKPGGLRDIETQGFVKAFDCRNTDNVPYLPAIGTGSPPCLLQGPWEFNGTSAFYPRLQLAPK